MEKTKFKNRGASPLYFTLRENYKSVFINKEVKAMRKRESGQSAVEFALVLPILLLLVCGIIDFGWLFYNQLSVENACREGARVACVNTALSKQNLDKTAEDKVKENIASNLQSLDVDVTLTNTSDPASGDVIVEVKADMRTLTPVLGVVYGAKKQLSYKVTMKAES